MTLESNLARDLEPFSTSAGIRYSRLMTEAQMTELAAQRVRRGFRVVNGGHAQTDAPCGCVRSTRSYEKGSAAALSEPEGSNSEYIGRLPNRGKKVAQSELKSASRLRHERHAGVEIDTFRTDSAKAKDRCSWPAVFALVGLVIVLACTLIGIASMAHATESVRFHQAQYTEAYVHEGDTIWAIAEAHPLDGASTYDTVQWIMNENQIKGMLIHPGDVLLVPASS